MALPKADPRFDVLIERRVREAMPMLDMCKMVHSAAASALAAAIDDTLHTVIVELPIADERQAAEFAASAVRQLATFYATFPDRPSA